MYTDNSYYDVAIAGGGLAGLATSIQLARKGYSVVLFEKEKYPFHKVCGEYLSLESEELLLSLGLPLGDMHLPRINRLELTAPRGEMLQQALPLGGLGISRFTLDAWLFRLAKEAGVEVHEGAKVQDIIYGDDMFYLVTDRQNVEARVCCGCFGKRSNIDVKWKRKFIRRPPGGDNYVAVKYHALCEQPRDTISLHLFKGGYCGVSPIEDGISCICYLTTAKNLKASGNSIDALQRNLLLTHPPIGKVMEKASLLYHQPLTISQISFERKAQVENHALMIGDAAGMITPLCGNGMSMALLGSELAAEAVSLFLGGLIERAQMERLYTARWQQQFSGRLLAGRLLQRVFGNSWISASLISSLRHFPRLVQTIVRQTHG